jgi:hypothetical protein
LALFIPQLYRHELLCRLSIEVLFSIGPSHENF